MINEMRENHRRRLVLGAFKTRLHRLPSVDDIEYWINFLRIGNTLQDMFNCMDNSPVKADLAKNVIANDNTALAKDLRHKSGEAVAVRSGWAARHLFAVNSMAISKKDNAAERPSSADHRPQGVVQRVLNNADENIIETRETTISSVASLSSHDSHQKLFDELVDLPNGEFIETLYIKLLGRESDSDGKNNLLLSLSNSVSRKTLITDMDRSDEAVIYKARKDRQKNYLESFFGTVMGGVVLSTHASRILSQLTDAFQKNKQRINNAHYH